ncbi:MAG: phospho-N-acetylmuramoyl-pentapeptide-transferase [Ruminococcaceae bacterium]|nr:phospho-N-acetylmuramoyl-pentapeptide-transferase [Oscillospiraceae bacterium]
MLIFFILSVLLSFAVTVLLSKKYIPVLISKKMNQPIYEIGPRWHKSKAGTPTMGGIFFIIAILLTMAVLSFFAVSKEMLVPLWITLAMATLFAAVGMVDDYAKLIKKQNEGLKAYQKFLLQLVVASLYVGMMCSLGYMDTVIPIPFTEIEWDLGIAFYPLAVILIVGVDNSVNLTDGIDGLCASVTAVISAFFALFGFTVMSLAFADAVVCFAGALCGGMIGFLVYNWNPARIFMGDTGSLFLGGMVTGLAFLCDNPILILIVGLIYIIETVSVILQVGSYKLFKKRIFKMAPIHHHFEKCGWSERKIVFVAGAITAVLCAVMYCLSI